MGAIGGLVGLSGGANGTGFNGPISGQILQGVNAGQANDAYNQTQQGLGSQQALLQALQGQNGLSNQSSVFNQMQGTANQYQNLANGVGPNPAQAQLAQNTAANVAQTGALMAGQRGGAQNVGLLARQAGQQGAATQQQGVGQAATLQAQQQIAALQGLQAQQGALAGQANTMASNQIGQTNANLGGAQSQYSNVLGALGNLNNANVGMQSNINNVNGQLANTNMQGQQALIGGVLNAVGGGAAGAKGGIVKRYDEGGDVDNVPDTSTPAFGPDSGAAELEKGTSQAITGPIKSIMGGGGGGGIGALAMLADGGAIISPNQSAFGPQSSFGQFISQAQGGGGAPNVSTPSFGSDAGAQALQKGASAATKKAMGSGSGSGGIGGVDAGGTKSSLPMAGDAGEGISPMAALASKGGVAQKDYRGGGKVKAANPSQKATVQGDSYANDKIPAVLSEHEIVLPREVTMSQDPIRASANFVAMTLAKRRGKR